MDGSKVQNLQKNTHFVKGSRICHRKIAEYLTFMCISVCQIWQNYKGILVVGSEKTADCWTDE